jgi:DNA-binding GntR family transcriptional regulator
MTENPSEPKYVQPIQKTTSLANMAYDAIRTAIITGRIKPGQRMGQVELARELGVSERTVREAFARLVAKGLAVHEPYKGVRVSALPIEELREVYTMRALLEGHAMELAAVRISPAEIQQMRELMPMTSAINATSVENAQEANRQFHWIPIHAAGSRALTRVLEQLWEMMYAYDLIYQDPNEIGTTGRNDLSQHEALLNALEYRDGQQAAIINSEHIYSTMNTLLEHLERNSHLL